MKMISIMTDFNSLLFGGEAVVEDSFRLSSRNSSFIEPIQQPSTGRRSTGSRTSAVASARNSFATPARRERPRAGQDGSILATGTGGRSGSHAATSSSVGRASLSRTPGLTQASTPGIGVRSTIVGWFNCLFILEIVLKSLSS